MTELARFLGRGWSLLAAAASSPEHPMRLVALATVDEGRPEARHVILRAADRAAGWLEVHTDLATPKVAQLRARPAAAVLAWSPEDRLQVRATGRAAIRSGIEVAPIWERVLPASRDNYGARPAPGTPIESPCAYRTTANPARFAVLRLTIESLDLVHLSERQRRARFDRADRFAGTWLAP